MYADSTCHGRTFLTILVLRKVMAVGSEIFPASKPYARKDTVLVKLSYMRCIPSRRIVEPVYEKYGH